MLQRCVALNIAFTYTIHTLPLLYLRTQNSRLYRHAMVGIHPKRMQISTAQPHSTPLVLHTRPLRATLRGTKIIS